MGKDDKKHDSKIRFLGDEELGFLSGGALTEEEKELCWEQAKRLKMVMRLEDFKELNPDGGEKIDYICSIWDQVEVPFTLYDP